MLLERYWRGDDPCRIGLSCCYGNQVARRYPDRLWRTGALARPLVERVALFKPCRSACFACQSPMRIRRSCPLRHYAHGLSRHVLSIGSPPGWAQHVWNSLLFPHAAQAMQAAAIGQPCVFFPAACFFLVPAPRLRGLSSVSGAHRDEPVGRGAVSASCWACRWHTGGFSSIARRWHVSPPNLKAPLSAPPRRNAPAPPAPTNAAEFSPQPPPLAPKEKRLPNAPAGTSAASKAFPPTRPKLKNGEQPPKTATPPEHSRAPQAQSAKAPHLPLHNTPYSRQQGKTEAAAPRHTSFDAVDGPKFLQPPAPRYPRLAQRKGIEGQVLMELMIDAEGRLMSASIKKAAGTDSMKRPRSRRKAIFRPRPITDALATCIVLLPIHFTLRDAS